jgi:glutathione S-transferase
MQLIDQPQAPNPRRVNIFLAEKGIEIPRRILNIPKKEHLTPEIKALNPVQRLPILVLDDGTALSESMAICRYFEELQADPPLMGTTPLEKAVVEMWQRRAEFDVLGPIAFCFRHLHPAMAELEVPQVPAWGEANRERALAGLAMLDERLSTSEYLAGDAFTVADITALCAVDMLKLARIPMPGEGTSLKRWYDAVSARPSAKAGLA